ncbi:unnamed protein product [Ectocarpus fasciculatus]
MNAGTLALRTRTVYGRMRLIKTALKEDVLARKDPQERRLWGTEETLIATRETWASTSTRVREASAQVALSTASGCRAGVFRGIKNKDAALSLRDVRTEFKLRGRELKVLNRQALHMCVAIHAKKRGVVSSAGRAPGSSVYDRQDRSAGYASSYISVSAVELPPCVDPALQVLRLLEAAGGLKLSAARAFETGDFRLFHHVFVRGRDCCCPDRLAVGVW